MTSFAVPTASTVDIRNSRTRPGRSAAGGFTGEWVGTAEGVSTCSAGNGLSGLAQVTGYVGPIRGNLPGPSRRIVVEPIEVPAQPVQVPSEPPAEPAERPEGEPVPAR